MPKLIPVTAKSRATGEVFTYPSITAAAREGGFERSCIHDCLRGYREEHAGFEFTTTATQDIRAEVNIYERIAACLNEGLSRRQAAAKLGIVAKTINSKLAVIHRLGLLNPGVRA